MLKKIVFSAAIILISLFLCSAGCGNVAVSPPAPPSISISWGDSDFFGWGSQQDDNSGADGTFTVPESEALVVKVRGSQFNDSGKMYLFIRLKGTSPNRALFKSRMEQNGQTGQYETAIPRCIHFDPVGKAEKYVNIFPTLASILNNINVNIGMATIGLSKDYGFANSLGTELHPKFYIGSDNFSTPTNSFTMTNIAVVDDSIPGMFGGLGNPDFCRKNNISFQIPKNKYNNSKHYNYAMFTVTFNADTNPNGVTVAFDGFLPKTYSQIYAP